MSEPEIIEQKPIVEPRPDLILCEGLTILLHPAGDWIYNIKCEDAVKRKVELKDLEFGPPRATTKRTSQNLSADKYIGVYFAKK